ncbi:hypothetical protein FBF28_04290 [Candidatus Saccharibacteria bacterium oral taxon 488]|nr:hypothetical protein FBF28_04290 [Candidatus Saccharibacteria bacterium oral taxon 488]
MIGATSTAEVSPTGIDGDNFDVFSSLRDGASSEDFSSGIGETVADSVEQFDLVAVASGEAELNTVTNSKPESKETSAPVNPEQCQKYGTIACIGCGLRQFCEERQAAMMAGNTELQSGEQLSTLEQLLREDDAPGEIVWAQPLPDDFDGEELPVADGPRVVETSADKPDGPTEKITPQEQESKASTSKPVEVSGEDMDTEAAEAPFFGLKMAPETIADDIKDVGESRPESASEVPVNTSGKEQFTEPTEENRPSIEIKQQTSAIISDAVDKENQQPVFQSPDIPTQTQTKTVPSSPGVSEDTQTGDESCNPLENETVYPTASEDKVAASVVENTYDGDETTAPSSVKTPSIERQKEKVFVITGSESANSEPSRAAENDESTTPVSEQQHLAAQFEAVKVDESATTGPIDNSGTKASTDAQPSEISIDAAPDYNNFVESTDGVDVEQPKHVIPTASNVSPYQEQEDAVNVSAEYETNETSTEKMVNAAALIPAKEQPDQPVIVSLSAQDIVEYGEDNEAWAEEDMVFFVEQQAPVVEPGVSSAEVVTIALPMEATTVREEVDDLKLSVDDEIGVDMDSAGQLDNSKAVSVPKITNDYEPEGQIVIPASPAIELIPDFELDEPAVEILEERIMPREERDNMTVKTSEKSDLLRLDAEVETITMDTSSIESVVDLSEEQEELTATEVSEAVESEVDEQNDLAVDSAVDSYGYNSETSAVSDNVLVVKSCQSPGLWPDDSQLNPEEEFTTTTQSSADDSSLVSRLVGMFVVAMCVVRGRQSVKV